MHTDFTKKIDAFIAENKTQIIQDIGTLIAIPSVSVDTPNVNGAPFGKEVRKVLDTALSMAQNMGLQTDDCNGYMGTADVKGESDKQVAIIAHLDVVPAGNGWTGDAFTMEEKDGWLIGRGVADDKGPAILALYVAKFFAQQGKLLPYTLRVLLGTSEETGMDDVHYYLKNYPMPAFCFTPDAEFPVCNGEKGGFNANFTSEKITNGNLLALQGGIVVNAVPDRATALVKGEISGLQNTATITVSEENGNVRLQAVGKGGHAAMPENTVNAIGELAQYLLANQLCTAQEETFLQLLCTLNADTNGKALGIASQDNVFTPLTCVGGVIQLNDGVITQSIDIRYPTSTTGETLTEILSAQAKKHNATLTQIECKKPFYISADSEVIQTLISTYNEVTGKNETPFTMGGGTYARYFANAVSFGPETVDMELPSFAGPMHGANEGANIEQLMQALKIYILATYRLMQLDL